MIYLADIISDSIVDGPGLRTTIFCQGCPHHCPGCHNMETWPFEGGTPLDTEAILNIIRSNPLSRGVTFSGGEPFAQADGFTELAIALKELKYEVASYSGYTFDQLLNGTEAQKELLRHIDVLIDGPYLKEERTLSATFRGSKNQRIINVPASLEAGHVIEITSGRWVGEY